MSIVTAHALFGREAVQKALEADEWQGLSDAELARFRLMANRYGPGVARSFALSQPWTVFVALVRLICGDTANDELGELPHGTT